jgi:hypothetical protein
MKFHSIAPSIFTLTVAMLLAGCVDQGSFPSLAKRPFEIAAGVVAPVPVAKPETRSDLALVARIEGAVKKARSGTAAYDAALPAARAKVAEGAASPHGSDSWINAQVHLTRLERTLEPARYALADLDAERRLVQLNTLSADGPALASAIAEVEGIADSQSAEVRQLLNRLNR